MSIKAFDMSQYQRIIGNKGSRVRGNWHALGGLASRPDEVLIWPIDVTIYADDAHSWGRVISRDDFSATVTNGVPALDPERIRNGKRPDCEDAWDELMAVLVAVAAEFQNPHKEPTDD